MKALTVQQPWAWAIIHGGKDVENRTRNIAGNYRGPVGIHASQTLNVEGLGDPTLWEALRPIREQRLPWSSTPLDVRGAFIGVALLWAVHRAAPSCCPNRGAAPFGSPWAQPDAVHLALSDPRPLAEPIPCRGQLGLWTPPSDVADAIAAQLEASR